MEALHHGMYEELIFTCWRQLKMLLYRKELINSTSNLTVVIFEGDPPFATWSLYER